MTVSPEDDFAAAEYALGTLDASERATLAARRLREPDLYEAILAWEARMAPLAAAVPEIVPPRDLLPAFAGSALPRTITDQPHRTEPETVNRQITQSPGARGICGDRR